jgi:antitoxin (DNA-binding transcriptional repressor) of toxin-antitoxin stability system
MQVAVQAGTELDALFDRVEAGEDVVLTRGEKRVRLEVVSTTIRWRDMTVEERKAAVERAVAGARPTPGPSAARSADWLYGEDGLPA